MYSDLGTIISYLYITLKVIGYLIPPGVLFFIFKSIDDHNIKAEALNRRTAPLPTERAIRLGPGATRKKINRQRRKKSSIVFMGPVRRVQY